MARQTFAPRLSSVPAARHWIWQSYCAHCAPGADRALLELLTSEVVANAVLHSAGEVVVELTCTEERVRVAVSDASPLLPQLRRAGPEVVGGHGVALVDALASRWGVQAAAGTDAGTGAGTGTGTGKTVWFELTGGA